MSDVPGLRKAAVLMVQLGKERSARVLAKMRESEVEAITAEIAQLDSIDPSLADRVVAEFQEMALAHRYYNRGGLALAVKFSRRASVSRRPAPSSSGSRRR